MALFDGVPRIFRTPAELKDASAQRTAALGLGQLFNSAYQGAKERAQRKQMFDIQQAQRKVEYENDATRQDKQFKLQRDTFELTKKRSDFQFTQAERQVKEMDDFLTDMHVINTLDEMYRKDPTGDYSEYERMVVTPKGKEMQIQMRRGYIDQNSKNMISDITTSTKKAMLAIGDVQNMMKLTQLEADYVNTARTTGQQNIMPISAFLQGLSQDPRYKDIFGMGTVGGGMGMGGGGTTATFRTNRYLNQLRLQVESAREAGDTELAGKLQDKLEFYTSPMKKLFPRLSSIQNRAMQSEFTVGETKFKSALEMAVDDEEVSKLEQKLRDNIAGIVKKYETIQSGGGTLPTVPGSELFPGFKEMLDKDLKEYRQ